MLAILFFILRLPSLSEPYWYGDEGIYLAIGQALRHGLLLYQQIHDNKPPTLYLLAVLSKSVFAFRLLLSLWMIPTIYFFHRLTKKFLPSRLSYLSTLLFLILTSIPLLEGNIANAEVFMLLPTILAFLIFLNYKKSPFSLLLSGLLLGFAFTIKIPVAFEFGLLCLWILLFHKSKIKNLFLISVSFILPIFLYFIYFYFRGAALPFLYSSLLQNFGYLSSWATGSQQSSLGSGGLFGRAAITFISLGIFYFCYSKKYLSKDLLFLLSWFSLALFGVLLSGRPYPHYLIQILPSLCLLLFTFSQARLLTFISFSVLVFSLFHFKFYFYPVFRYYGNYYSYLFHQKSLADYRRFFAPDINDIYLIADKIKSLSSPSDYLYIWGDQAYLYPLSDRLPATKYIVAYHVLDFKGYDITIKELRAKTPKLIIYFPQVDRPFPDLDNFISEYYFLVDQIGQANIYQLRSQL